MKEYECRVVAREVYYCYIEAETEDEAEKEAANVILTMNPDKLLVNVDIVSTTDLD